VKAVILSTVALLMFVSIGSADVFITSDGTGTYVGGLPGFAPGGAYISGTPTITKDGLYVDGMSQKKYSHKKWQKLRNSQIFKLSSSLKTQSN